MGLARRYEDIEQYVDAVLERVGNRVVLGLPLGLGKAAHFANAIYRRAVEDPAMELQIFTALTLEPRSGPSFLEARLSVPIVRRLFRNHVELDYARAMRSGELPINVSVSEFYLQPGAHLSHPLTQQSYVSINYSQAARELAGRGVNVIAQLIAKRSDETGIRYSISSNPDLTLDLLDMMPADRRPVLIGEVSSEMPFMTNDAELTPQSFDFIIDDPRFDTPLTPLINKPVSYTDYAIAIHVTSLITDGGTLQLGIGSLADAIAYVIRLRHEHNTVYRGLLEALSLPAGAAERSRLPLETGRFSKGLYGGTEMLVEGMLHLLKAGILGRRVSSAPHPASDTARPRTAHALHAGFFLGSARFYELLRQLPDDERDAINLTSVLYTNTLRGARERKIEQRTRARFINSAMMATLTGAVVSDGLEDGRVVSGVGGQNDFVTMAQELPEARSVIVLPSTRADSGRTRSNIVFSYPHTTIPRQLRDVVVTEYGVADLRGRSDRDVIAAMLRIADSRFQPQLLQQAIAAAKIEAGYRIPEHARHNLPGKIRRALAADPRAHSKLPHYPFGTDLTDAEARLAIALTGLKAHGGSFLGAARLLLGRHEPPAPAETMRLLQRMGLDKPKGLRQRFFRRLLLGAIAASNEQRPLKAWQ